MSVRKSLSAVVTAVALMVSALVIAPAASATSTAAERSLVLAEQVYNSANPEEAFGQLSDADKKIMQDYLTVDKVENVRVEKLSGPDLKVTADGQYSLAASGCTAFRQYMKAYNNLGLAIVDYWTTASVCSNGATVTSVHPIDANGFSNALGYRYEGNDGIATGIVSNTGFAYSVHRLAIESFGYELQQRSYCARVIGNAVAVFGDGRCGIG